MTKRLSLAVLLAVALGAAGYGWFIYHYGAPYAAGSDSSGYLNSARLLAQGQLSEPVRTIPGLQPPDWSYYLYQPLGFNVDQVTGRMVPSYQIGLPLHYAAAAGIVGFEKAARLVNLLNVIAAGGLLYALARKLGLARPWAVAAITVLWASPVWVYQSLQPMSDAVATTWAIAAVYAACRAPERPAWAAAAGAAFAGAVLVRPTSLVLILPLAVALGGNRRAWVAFVLGGLPFGLGLGAYNFAVYGSVIATGYNHAGFNILDSFGWQYFNGNLRHFAKWLALALGVPLVVLAVVGLPWVRRRSPRTTLLLVSWLAAFVGLYSCYYCAGEAWWYLRFLLPAFPAVILAGLLVLQQACARLPGKVAWLAPLALLLANLHLQTSLCRRLHLTDIRTFERNYWLAGCWLRDHAPTDAILLAWNLSGSVTFYTHLPMVRWDLLNPLDFDRLVRSAVAQHRPVYAALFAFEKAELSRKFGGNWRAIDQAGNVTIWELELPPAEANK